MSKLALSLLNGFKVVMRPLNDELCNLEPRHGRRCATVPHRFSPPHSISELGFMLVFWFAALTLVLLPAAFARAAEREPAFDENFYGVTIIDDDAWIVGYYGTILHSRDRGLTWKVQNAPSRNALYSVRFVTPEDGWVSGSYGALLRTRDGGRTWSLVSSGTEEHLFSMSRLGQHGWAAGSRGTLLRTEDGGASWVSASLKEDLTLSSIFFVTRLRGWVAGEFGVILHTQDGGKTWLKQSSPIEVTFASGESRMLFALLFRDHTAGFAFGIDGLVLSGRDGTHWQITRSKPANGANHLFAAAMFREQLWAVGERGTLLQGDLNGGNWHAHAASIPPVSLNGIAFGKNGFGLIVGNRGLVLRTDDGGETWRTFPNQRLIMARD
jgi:photosystem II stability/assembly factor-like uncharacterized protein